MTWRTPYKLSFLVTLMVLLVFGPYHGKADEENVQEVVHRLEAEWEDIFYRQPKDQHAKRFKELLERVHQVSETHSSSAEPLVLEAIVLCTYAGAEFGFSALTKVKQARKLLRRAIDIDPRAMEGSAYVTLGNLYYRLPGWPISFGDNDVARQYLQVALKLFPDALDANYFYGDFLLNQGEYEQAIIYLERAEQAPIRPHMALSDAKLKEEVHTALLAARAKGQGRTDFFSKFMPSF
jgi:tetratricopeptide (TPR) repeat protein